MSPLLKTSKWVVGKSKIESPREHLLDSLGPPTYTSDGKAVWEKERYHGLYTETYTHQDGEFKLKSQISGHKALFGIYTIGLLSLIYTFLNGKPTAGLAVFWSGVIYILFVPQYKSILFDIGELESRTVSSLFAGFLFFAFVVSWLTTRAHYPLAPVDELSLLILLMLLFFTYSLGLLPISPSNPSVATLTIPAIIIQRVLFTIILFTTVAFIGGYYLIQVNALFDYASSLERINHSTADMLDHQTRQTAKLRVAAGAGSIIGYSCFLIPIYFIGEMIQSRRILRLLYNIKPKPFSSKAKRNLFFVLYLASTSAIILLLLPIISILAYGFLGYLPLPGAETYTQRFVAEPVQFYQETYSLAGNSTREPLLDQPRQITSVNLIKNTYAVTDRIAAQIPLPIPNRSISIGILGILLLPTLMFIQNWVVSLPIGVVNKFRVISSGDEIDYNSSNVPDRMTVLKVDDEYGIVARPQSIFFGLKQYILIGDSAHKKLNKGDELDAALAHEVYHIQNRDLKIGALSKLLSFCFGGKNAILAFYDYPKIEQEADEHAARAVGKEPTKVAISKLDEVALELSGRKISETTPGIVSSEKVEKYNRKISDLTEAMEFRTTRKWLSKTPEILKLYLNAPENLLHKNVLMERSHEDPEVRIQRIDELDL